MWFRTLLIAAWILVASAGTASAHHSEDPTSGTPIEWTGKIVFVSWDGAHAMYRIEVESPQRQEWGVLGASPKILASRHITKTTLKPGDVVTVKGWLNPYSKIISPVSFTKTDGQAYVIGFFPRQMTRTP